MRCTTSVWRWSTWSRIKMSVAACSRNWGSGAIESAIRRVINLRLKGNSISWYEENAEGMMLLRCLVLSNRWDDAFVQISASLASDRRLDWTFRSPDMPAQLKANITIEPPKPQVTAKSAPYATAA